MASEASEPYLLERMLLGTTVEPMNLPISLLNSITNNFSDDQQIGRGGFAVVYKGTLKNGVVAVKKLRQSLLDMDEQKFHQEVDSMLRVKHKNIVRFLGYCSDTQGIVQKFEGRNVMVEERQRFLCFEFLPIGSLDKYISDPSGGLEWRTRYEIIKGICEGLHYLHQQRIVHLDLKPANILLDQYMVPKIADFGISRCFDEKQSRHITSHPCGSLGYMAPESHGGLITLKSDIYSLGIIIIEILTGHKGCPVIENVRRFFRDECFAIKILAHEVLQSWSIRFETSPDDTRLEPIRVCAELGIECTDFNPRKRPNSHHIIERIEEMESTNCIIFTEVYTSSVIEASSSVSKLVDEVQSKFVFDEAPSRLQRITRNAPKGLEETSTEVICSIETFTNQFQSKTSLDIGPQTSYPHVQSPISSPVQGRGEWGVLGKKYHQVIPDEIPRRNVAHDDMGESSVSIRNQFMMDVPTQVPQHDSHSVQFDIDTKSHNPQFKGLSRADVLDGFESGETKNAEESSAQSVHEDSSGLEHASPSYSDLPTILEEPDSSLCEEYDPLPGIDRLQINGEPFPGRELQASGYPTNGTTTCNFEWFRHLEDGSINVIEGARCPSYVVTADDVGTILAIEVEPIDDRKRKGEVIKVYADEQRNITCDPEMKELIQRTFKIGHVTYEVQVTERHVRFLDMWEPAVLAIKREGYSIKCNAKRDAVITEKFKRATGVIDIPNGSLSEFTIASAGDVYYIRAAENMLSRDTIVLVLRLFKKMAVERRRKGLFFR